MSTHVQPRPASRRSSCSDPTASAWRPGQGGRVNERLGHSRDTWFRICWVLQRHLVPEHLLGESATSCWSCILSSRASSTACRCPASPAGRGRRGCVGAAHSGTYRYTHTSITKQRRGKDPACQLHSHTGGVDRNMNEHSLDDCLINPSNRPTVESGTAGVLGVHWLSKLCFCSLIHGHCGLKYIAG